MTDKSIAQKHCPTCGFSVNLSVSRCPRDGTDLSDPLQGEPDFQGKYVYQGLIGSGGMGVIYKAHQLGMDRDVAIKMLHPHLVGPNTIARFQIEGRAASLLKHQYIVQVHDLGVTVSGQPYMVMDYVNGTTLADILASQGQIPHDRFLNFFLQVCDALAHAHKQGILHRDVKPSNIMVLKFVDGSEEVRIMDFGVAKILTDGDASSHNLTRTGETVGSPTYMSPEQGKGKDVDVRSDLYSLGCVMYEALTGTPPFIGSSALETMLMHAKDQPLPVSEASLGNAVDPRVERSVLKLLEKEPRDRYQSMDDLRADLRSIQSNPLKPVQPPSNQAVSKPGISRRTPRVAPKQKGKNKAIPIVVAVVSIILISAGGIYVALRNKQVPVRNVSPSGSGSGVTPDNLFPDGNKVEHHAAFDEHSEMRELVAYQLRMRTEGGIVDLSGMSAPEFKHVKPNIQDLDLLKSDEAVTFVRSLILSDTQITDKELEIIKNLKLRTLFLDDDPVEDLYAIKDMKTLQGLSLKGSSVGRSGLSIIAHLPHLSDLNLSGTKVTDDDLAILSKLPLQRLVLDHTVVTDLHALKEMNSLEQVSVVGTKIGKPALEVLKNLPNLKLLNINQTQITDADLPVFEQMKSLQRLDIQMCPGLTRSAVLTLQQHLPHSCRVFSDLFSS